MTPPYPRVSAIGTKQMQAEKRREARERRAERKPKEVAQAIAVRKFLEAVNRYT